MAKRSLRSRLGCLRPEVFVFIASFAAFGQMNTGEVSGSVLDVTSSALSGASVVALQMETGQKFTTASNSSGEYLFAQLPVGSYSLTVSAANFRQATLLRLDVHVSDRLRQSFTLEVVTR